jgi:hypothetical protein
VGRRQGRARQRLQRAELCQLRRSIRYLSVSGRSTCGCALYSQPSRPDEGGGPSTPPEPAERQGAKATTMGSFPCLRTIPDVMTLVTVPVRGHGGISPLDQSAGDHGEIEVPRPLRSGSLGNASRHRACHHDATVPAQPRPPKHRTKVRHRRDLWVASCTCDWSEETVSRFSVLMALRRHQVTQGRPDLQDTVRQT